MLAPIFIGASTSNHGFIGVFLINLTIYTPITKKFPTPTRWLQFLPSRHSSCIQFPLPSRTDCRQITPCRVSSPSGTKAGTTSKTFFKLRASSFVFTPKGTAGRLQRLDSAENALLKLNRSLPRKPPASTASESTLVAFEPFAKPQVADLRYRQEKGVASGGFPVSRRTGWGFR